MIALLSLIAAVFPMVGFVIVVWWMDRYDREPISLVGLNFLWGAFGAVALAIIGNLLLTAGIANLVKGKEEIEFLSTVAVAPVVEESTKGLFLLLTAMSRRFDNVTDGAVYGASIGFGFGMTENFLYFLSFPLAEGWLILVIIRTFFSAVMHAMATGVLGAFVGFAKFRPRGQQLFLWWFGWLIAVGFHVVWNASVSFEGGFGYGVLFIIVGVCILLALFQISLLYEHRVLRAELSEESLLGVIPGDHVAILPSFRRRKRREWCPPGVNRKAYIRLATELAFRKHQSRICQPSKRELYLDDVAKLRNKILMLLKTPVWNADTRSLESV
ncbi:MAG: PrsW family intramembrane metalloprotease [Bacteroidota bacterium]